MAAAREAGVRIVGPNTAGVVTPGECFVGFMPAFNDRVFRPGEIGVVSRSGSLGTLLALNLVQGRLGISAFIGIGGAPPTGTQTRDAVEELHKDARPQGTALIAAIGAA